MVIHYWIGGVIEVGYMVYDQEILYMCVQGQVINYIEQKNFNKRFLKKAFNSPNRIQVYPRESRIQYK